MTESTWPTSTTIPAEMIRYAMRRVAGRKLRQLALATCRLVQVHISRQRPLEILDQLELVMDSASDVSTMSALEAELLLLTYEAVATSQGSAETAAIWALATAARSDPVECAVYTLPWVEACISRVVSRRRKKAVRELRLQVSDLIREVIGNPYRPWKGVPDFLGGGIVQPDGRTVHLSDTARQLAHGIHVDQAFDRLPILADALEESGITDAALLTHCRQETRHVRGCWALDVALGRI